jgi:DNA-binding LytR/AlgR family response regulator
MITAIAIDDEPLALHIIKAFCDKVDYIDLQKTFTETGEALKYLRKFPVDLLFLDIRMPSMSGIDFYKSAAQNTMVIFTTAFSEYAVEGFNLSAVDYLLKPFDFTRFKQAVEKANDFHKHLNRSEGIQEKYLFIRADYALVKIEHAEIEYVEGLDNYLKVHLTNKKSVVARMSMKAMEEKLPPSEFMRIHRSYIIPLSKVNSLRGKNILLKSGAEIPVGTNYTDKVQALFK